MASQDRGGPRRAALAGASPLQDGDHVRAAVRLRGPSLVFVVVPRPIRSSPPRFPEIVTTTHQGLRESPSSRADGRRGVVGAPTGARALALAPHQVVG